MSLEVVLIGRHAGDIVIAATTSEPAVAAEWSVVLPDAGATVRATLPTLDGQETDGNHIQFAFPPPAAGRRITYRILRNGQTATVRAPRHGGSAVLAEGSFLAGRERTTNEPFSFAVAGDQEAFRARASNLDNSRTTTQIYCDIETQQPDFFVQLGDIFLREPAWRYVPKLGDLLTSKPPSMGSLRKGLRRDFHQIVRGTLRNIPAFRLLDDHDFRFNGLGAALRDHGDPAGTNRHLKRQQLAVDRGAAAFQEFWPMDGPDGSKGLFYRFEWGPCAFIGLNARAFADPHDTSDRRNLLGEQQWTWLQTALREASEWARFIFILSPLPFAFGKEASEDFRGAPVRWRQLLSLFAQHNVSAILTADSHNYSRGHIEAHGRLIPQFLVGTLGGRPQHNPVEFWRGGVHFETTGEPPDDGVDLPEIRLQPQAYYSARYTERRARFGHALIRVDPAEGTFTLTHYLRHVRGETEVFDQATYSVARTGPELVSVREDMTHTLPLHPQAFARVRDIAIDGVTPTGLAWHPGRDTLLVVGREGTVCELAPDDGSVLMRIVLRSADGVRNLQGVAVTQDGVIVVLDATGVLIALDSELAQVAENAVPSPFRVGERAITAREPRQYEGLCIDADGRIVVSSRQGDTESEPHHAVLYGIDLRGTEGLEVVWRRPIGDDQLTDIERVPHGYWAVSDGVLAELDESWGEPQIIPIPSEGGCEGITRGPDGTAYLAITSPPCVRLLKQTTNAVYSQ